MEKIRVAVVTNMPTPYREGVYSALSQSSDIDLCLFYCQRREANRYWEMPPSSYKSRFLNTKAVQYRGQYIHFGKSILYELERFDPQVVITSGYGPVMLLAVYWCIKKGVPHLPFTDGTPDSESGLTLVHRLVRRFIFYNSVAFIGASKKSLELFKSYGVDNRKLFQSCLSIDNSLYSPHVGQIRQYDLLFAGQLIERKMPAFFVSVAREIAFRRGGCRVLVLGSGPLHEQIRQQLSDCGVDLEMPGFIQPVDLPSYYRQARLFLFPTRQEPWGVVANEAAAAGLPIITVPEAGVADELVQHGCNGFVLPAEICTWADAAQQLLDDPQQWECMSKTAQHIVSFYNIESAVNGLLGAIQFAFKQLPSKC